ncbi:unnamed protein product [Ophioblennius macclurei]
MKICCTLDGPESRLGGSLMLKCLKWCALVLTVKAGGSRRLLVSALRISHRRGVPLRRGHPPPPPPPPLFLIPPSLPPSHITLKPDSSAGVPAPTSAVAAAAVASHPAARSSALRIIFFPAVR